MTAEELDAIIAWLAPRLLTAADLMAAHRGELAFARARISASAQGWLGGGISYAVRGPDVNVEYPAGNKTKVSVMTCLKYARANGSDRKARNVHEAYLEYIRTHADHRQLRPLDQTRDAWEQLQAAELAWWLPDVPTAEELLGPVQPSLFEAVS